MAFLTVNGYTIPIAEASPKGTTREIGTASTGLLGSTLKDNRGELRAWTVTTVPDTEESIDALRRLLVGRGYVWHFDDLGGTDPWQWSANGLGSYVGSGVSQLAGSAHFGDYGIELTATTGTASFATDLPSTWTAMCWVNTGSGFYHYAETSDGLYFVNGVAAAQESWFDVSISGNFTLQNTTGGAVDFDDLVVLPYVITADMIAAFGTATEAFGSLPRLNVSGDVFGADVLEMMLVDEIEVEVVQAKIGANFQTLHQLTFTLEEQEPATALGAFENALSIDFDGTADYLEVLSGNYTELDGATDYTISVWILNDASPTNEHIIGRFRTTAGSAQFSVFQSGTNWRLFHSANGTSQDYTVTTGGPLAATGSWYHLCATKAGTVVTLFTNGAPSASAIGSGTVPAVTPTVSGNVPLRIGALGNATASFFFGPGNISDCAIWRNVAATGTQVLEIYGSHAAVDLNNLATMPRPTNFWWMGDRDQYNQIADNGSSTTKATLTMISMAPASIVADVP